MTKVVAIEGAIAEVKMHPPAPQLGRRRADAALAEKWRLSSAKIKGFLRTSRTARRKVRRVARCGRRRISDAVEGSWVVSTTESHPTVCWRAKIATTFAARWGREPSRSQARHAADRGCRGALGKDRAVAASV